MKFLILAAGRFDQAAVAQAAAADREPRLDVCELRDALGADLLDFGDVDRSRNPAVRVLQRTVSDSAALALLGFNLRRSHGAVFTTGEDIGLPLAALLKARRARLPHTMIAHTLAPASKRLFFSLLRVQDRIDQLLCYATSEERLAVDELGMPAAKVRRIAYHADERFFRPGPPEKVEKDLICSAGQLLRDYPTLIEAARELPARLCIAAGSPWINKVLRPESALPPNVDWRKYDRFALRDLYQRSALAVVPIQQNEYQTGISTILEMMAMGKCVIVTRTRGQTDTIVDGENGFYVPPADPAALRAVLQRLLADPEEAARVGRNARRYVEENAGLDLFTARLVQSMRGSVGGSC